MTGTPKNPRGRHLSRPRRPFWGPLAVILDFAGGERVPPAPLGWYFIQNYAISWIIIPCLETVGNLLTPCHISRPSFGPLQAYSSGKTNHRKQDVEASLIVNTPGEVTEVEEYIKFKFSTLVSNIGGYFGLFLGVSLLHVWDLISFLQAMCKRN